MVAVTVNRNCHVGLDELQRVSIRLILVTLMHWCEINRPIDLNSRNPSKRPIFVRFFSEDGTRTLKPECWFTDSNNLEAIDWTDNPLPWRWCFLALWQSNHQGEQVSDQVEKNMAHVTISISFQGNCILMSCAGLVPTWCEDDGRKRSDQGQILWKTRD